MTIIILSRTINKLTEEKTKQEKYISKSNYNVKESRELLDYLVEQKLTEWQIYNIDPSSDNYVTEENMKDAIEYIIKKIIMEMTPVSKNALSVGYPMETEEEMIESIKNCAKIAVLNYTIQQNASQEHDEVIANINAF